MQVVLATRNAAKGREIARLLLPLPNGVVVQTLADYPDCPEIVEDGRTFSENALIKARAACRYTGAWSVADDSGLMVDHLGGEPGVNSARYCGRHGDDKANNLLLLSKLAGVPPTARSARFVTAVAIVGPDGQERVIEGECHGQIAPEPRGSGGFGYDCLFWRPDQGKTFAELSEEQKDALSHRGQAFSMVPSILWQLMGLSV